MSVCATLATWKLGKKVTAIQKLLLLSLADRADESGKCWPSLKRIEEDTNLNKKTIFENRKLLLDKGLIIYTGKYKGRYKQIPVMQLTYIHHREGDINLETEQNFTVPEIGYGIEEKEGTVPEIGYGGIPEIGYGNLSVEPISKSTTMEKSKSCAEAHPPALLEAKNILKKYEISIPKKLNLQCRVYLTKALDLLLARGYTLEDYLSYLITSCPRAMIPYIAGGKERQNGFGNILRPSFINAVLSGKWSD